MKKCNTCAAMHKDGEGCYCEFLEIILDLHDEEEAPCLKEQ